MALTTETTDAVPTPDVRGPKPRIDLVVFGVTAAAVIAFVIWGLLDKESLNTRTQDLLAWITDNLGWVFILSATFFVLFAIFLAVSKYGKIPLGRDGEKPEYNTVSWIATVSYTHLTLPTICSV